MPMDFQLVTSKVLRDLDEEGVRFALIGGFDLGLWGATRATIDLDFLLMLEDFGKAEPVLSNYSYRCTHRSGEVAQFVSDLAPFGQIDVLLAHRAISMGMLKRSVVRKASVGELRVLLPEDLIGLKLQAMVNDVSRTDRDLADMRALLAASKRAGRDVDWDLLGDYFELFGKGQLLEELRKAYG